MLFFNFLLITYNLFNLNKANLNVYNNNNAIIFYTGGGNTMPIDLYSDFLNNIQNNNDISIYDSKKIVSFENLKKKHNNLILIGHSSGCSNIINNVDNNINSIFLLDPVIIPFYYKKKNVDFINKIFIINAAKSYKWNILPPFFPFIPFLNINKKNINYKDNINLIEFANFGHCDLINNPYRDFMHFSRIAIGNDLREDKLIFSYHNKISNFILKNINE